MIKYGCAEGGLTFLGSSDNIMNRCKMQYNHDRPDRKALCVEEGFFFAAADGAADSITQVSVCRFYLLWVDERDFGSVFVLTPTTADDIMS